jgi:preprotein translocase subunit SecA
MKKYIYQIKQESDLLRQKTDEELALKINAIKKRSKTTILDNLIIEWFSLVQEISWRKIGLKHFDTQLLAGIYLHQGKIVEMKTGEGKTLASTLPVALNALSGKGVHVITVNDYLAERDQNWMGKIYKGLNLTVGLIKSGSNYYEKRKNYQADITYLTNSELVFDFLRDSTALQAEELVQRAFHYCVLDEIDSILIDEARTPLILSMPEGEKNLKKLSLAKTIAYSLEKGIDFELDQKRREINLTEKGYQEVKEKLGKDTLYDLKDPWILDILNALKAKYLFQINKDYIILKNKIVIVDEFTGRVMEDRRWSMGIHEAIEMKEKLAIGNVTRTKTSITYQNFFTLYPKLSGMTGTAKTAEKEFQDIYGLNVVVLPTWKPMIRKDFPDLVYQTELAKWKAVLTKAKECFQRGQPILIGTSNVEKSEFLSELFTTSGIPHEILNAKPENVFRESEIVAQAGEPYAVTIATNMAGRGTDIILGGNPTFKVKQILTSIYMEHFETGNHRISSSLNNLQEHEIEVKSYFSKVVEEYQKNSKLLVEKIFEEDRNFLESLEKDISNLPYSLDLCLDSLRFLYNYLYQKIYVRWQEQNIQVKNLGGLFVLGTERHETRRIDNQLRGRAGRQGDPGVSQFFISLDDELIKIFGGDSIRRWLNYLMDDPDIPLESSFLTQSLEQAQEKVELYNYEIRKNIFQYDEIINSQRKQFFEGRKELLSSSFYHELALRYAEFHIDQEFLQKKKLSQKNTSELSLEKHFPYFTESKNFRTSEEIWIGIDLRFAHSNVYQLGFFQHTQNQTLLSLLDFYWTEHIERMDYIRDTINWRSYGQQNPLIEYNMEAFGSYQFMFQQIRQSMIYFFLENPIFNFNLTNKKES